MQPSISGKSYSLILRRIGDLPSLPDVVNRIIEALSRQNVPASEVARLISYDPGLTSKFLRIVNSAAYGFPRQISSVQHAIMLLGFNMVRGVVLSASIFKILGPRQRHGIDPNAFWVHSIGTAIASRIIAVRFNVEYADDAFSAGMLHDIGKMILDYYFTEDYQLVLAMAKKEGVPLHGQRFLEMERSVLGLDHASLGYHLAQRWRLPTTFAHVIRYHHTPEEAKSATDLVYTIALANAMSKMIQLNEGVLDLEQVSPEVLAYFYYDPENPRPFERLFDEIMAEMDGIDELLNTLQQP